MIRFVLLAVALLFVVQSTPEVGAAEKSRILFLTQSKGFMHGAVRRPKDDLAPSEVAMKQLAQETGLFTVDCTQDAEADFTKENLQNYDIVMFYTTGELPIADEDRDYFINEWLKQEGHGFIGVHSATDTYRNKNKNEEFRWYWEMVGGTFNGHPWNAGTTVTMTVHDPSHPTMRPFGSEYVIKDEIYQYFNWQPEKVRVLMSLNMEKTEPKRPYHVPVAWVKAWGEGKVYVNNLGHNNSTWTNKDFLKSLEMAVKWIRNEADGETQPNPSVSEEMEERSKKAAT